MFREYLLVIEQKNMYSSSAILPMYVEGGGKITEIYNRAEQGTKYRWIKLGR